MNRKLMLWGAIGVFAALTFALGTSAVFIRFDFSLESLFLSKDEKKRDYEHLQTTFGSDDAFVVVAFRTDDVLTPKVIRYIDSLSARLEKIDGVVRTLSLVDALWLFDSRSTGRILTLRAADLEKRPDLGPLLEPGRLQRSLPHLLSSATICGNLFSKDRRVTALLVMLDDKVRQNVADKDRLLHRLEEFLAEEGKKEGLDFRTAGLPVVEHYYTRKMRGEQLLLTPVSVVVIGLLLLLYFRRPAAIGLPLLVNICNLVILLGIMTLTGGSFNIISATLPVLILVIGITDAIHILNHFYADLEGVERDTAVKRTVRAMAVACLLTSATTAVGFLSLLVIDVQVVKELGVYSAAGLMLGYIFSITMIPVLLLLLPMSELRPPPVPKGFEERLVSWRLSTRNNLIIVVVGLGALGFFGYKISDVNIESGWFQDFTEKSRIYRDSKFIEENMGGIFTLELIVKGQKGAFFEPANLARIEAIEAAMKDASGQVTHTYSFADLLRSANRFLFGAEGLPASAAQVENFCRIIEQRGGGKFLRRAVTEDASQLHVIARMRNVKSKAFERFLDNLRPRVDEIAGKDLEVVFTGKSVLAGSAMKRIVDNMLSSFLLALVIIFVMMELLFRSLTYGIIGLIVNAVPMVVTLGMMPILGIDLNFSTLIVFSVGLGIAVDDTIHYMVRYRAELASGLPPRQAMVAAVRFTGRVIIFTSVMLMAGVSVMFLSSFKFLLNWAILMNCILGSALLGDFFLLPALLYFVDFARRRRDASGEPAEGSARGNTD